MNAQEFWYRYCRAQGEPNEMQEQAIDMFLESMQEVLWQAGRQSGRSTVRRGMIAFLQESEQFEDRRKHQQFEAWLSLSEQEKADFIVQSFMKERDIPLPGEGS